jgi:uncharacterized short protein YbdD (DUF466 family)
MGGYYVKEMIGFSNLELFKKDLIQFIVIILPGMDQDMSDMRVKHPDNPA